MSMRTLRPSFQPNCRSSCRSAAIRACPSGLLSAVFISTPMRRMRSGCCARAESGHVAAPLRMLRNSRRLMSAPWLRRRHRIGSNECFDRGRSGFATATSDTRRCPLWVKSGHDTPGLRCPLYPQKRTNSETVGLSALCHKPTHAPQQTTHLFDRLVDNRKHLLGYGEPHCVRGLETDDKLDLVRCLNRKIAWFFSPKDTVDVGRRLPIYLGQIDSIG